jgi:hypothetical protein
MEPADREQFATLNLSSSTLGEQGLSRTYVHGVPMAMGGDESQERFENPPGIVIVGSRPTSRVLASPVLGLATGPTGASYESVLSQGHHLVHHDKDDKEKEEREKASKGSPLVQPQQLDPFRVIWKEGDPANPQVSYQTMVGFLASESMLNCRGFFFFSCRTGLGGRGGT